MGIKIILAGATGFIGGEVLQQCLKNPAITSVVALSRHPLPEVAGISKVEVVIMQDFRHYPDEVLGKIAGADGCIWCMTKAIVDRTLELDYPKAFAEAISNTIVEYEKPFRYIHLSARLVENDPDKSLWIAGSMRKLKGELQMIEVAEDTSIGRFWETRIARPGMVVQRGATFGEALCMLGSTWTIRSDELALALIDTVVSGSNEQVIDTVTLRNRGQNLFKRKLESTTA
ncbi:hypothetical protein P154DRAFT_489448 [Amniculicola lignicola CBS 123094]|uniref:NAD(P)-binding domain-containing protein n=1 Tax=Amniculicola lignicola CBS 123094 TaxID=1392246 RepID=A0A6A5WJ61_9PLEO|nr:hypothetical protein P154DRAFT_489448 [Amniculicola lignicola CBS 123094]